MAPAIDWIQYEQLKAEGLADREIARRWGVPWGTFHWEKQKRGGLTARVSVQTPGVSKRVSSGVSKGCLSRSSHHCRPPREAPR